MKSFFILFIVLASSVTLASRVSRTSQNRLHLNGGCNDFNQQLSDLNSWLNHVENKSCTPPAQVSEGEGRCHVDITNCVPDHVQRYHGVSSAQSGPNCWNTALVMSNLVPHMRQSSSEEWAYYLESPLCRRLAGDEQRRPGDIGSIQYTRPSSNTTGQVHGFIHVSEDLVYAKDGIQTKDNYRLQSYEEMHQIYPVGVMTGECGYHCGERPLNQFMRPQEIESLGLTEFHFNPQICPLSESLPEEVGSVITRACERRTSSIEQNRDNCNACAPHELAYYRCISFDEYLSNAPIDTERFQRLNRLMANVDCNIERSLVTEQTLSAQNLQNITDSFTALGEYVNQNRDNAANESETFILSSIALRVNEAAYQLGSMAGRLPEARETNALARTIEQSLTELASTN